jgi:hypothetical protein
MKWRIVAALMLAIATCNSAVTPDVTPQGAREVGYFTRTYGPTPLLLTPKTRTTSAPGTAGLFPWHFVNQDVGGQVAVNADGSMQITGGNNQTNAQLASATSGDSAGTFQGIAFGGGAYFEAVLKFDGWHGQSKNEHLLDAGWAAFWGMAIEHLALTGDDEVPGMAKGYEHFIEMDFFEYNIAFAEHTDAIYSGSMIDTYGVWGHTCGKDIFCSAQNRYASKIRPIPPSTDLSEFHTYALLWVPATDDSEGFVRWYFDGAPVGQTVNWKKCSTLSATPSPPFCIADQQHLAVIVGTGAPYPMQVRSISVWQRSRSGNWVR